MTNAHRLTIVLTALKLVLLLGLLSRTGAAGSQSEAPVLRGQGLELVDAQGRVRGEFAVEPDGEAVFRIRDAAGRIRVKLGAGDGGSGLLLLDETTEPGVQIIARRMARTAASRWSSFAPTTDA